MSVDWDKPLQTRDGRKVRIYTTGGESKEYPVVGEYLNEHGDWTANSWMTNGESPYHRMVGVVNVPQQHTVWVNVHRTCDDTAFRFNFRFNVYDEKVKADENALSDRIACFEHTFTEGDGLE